MKSEAVPLVTIVALFRELRQELESKLLKPQSVLKITVLSVWHSVLATGGVADCQLRMPWSAKKTYFTSTVAPASETSS
jgi:hypothetical protein